ncbi:MAG: glycoside hydrolase family 3 C-terminal domain-containing protein, partial [Marinilabilia sp.]
KEAKSIATFGNASYEFISGGTGSGDVNEAYTISLIEGLENGGFEVDKKLEEVYAQYIHQMREKAGPSKNWITALMGGQEPLDEMEITPDLATQMAEKTDSALITIGRNSGEGGDREAVAGDFYLTNTEKQLIETVSKAFRAKGKKAIVVLNIGAPIETASWAKTPDAVLLAWQPGQEAGYAVTDVLSGKVTPSGKLAVTFPLTYEDAPTSQTFPGYAIEGATSDEADMSGFSMMRREPWEVVYEEDIFVGHRYYNTFDVPVAYEFGYGLSYTRFEYKDFNLSSSQFRNGLSASVRITNTGSVAGRETAQLYVSAPAGKRPKPASELIKFGKTGLLHPGDSETLTFLIQAKDIASFDEERAAWIAGSGEYQLQIGASSKKIKQATTFMLEEEMLVEQVTPHALAPKQKIKKLKT